MPGSKDGVWRSRLARGLRWGFGIGLPLSIVVIIGFALIEWGATISDGAGGASADAGEEHSPGLAGAPPDPGGLPPGGAAPPGEMTAEPRVVPMIAPPAEVGANLFPDHPAPLIPKPEAVRGIYLNSWSAGSRRRRAELMALAARTELNTFVIDVKEAGEVSYRSGIALARAIGADRDHIPDPGALLAELRSLGIYPIARIVVFKDPILAGARPEWAIQDGGGGLWRDGQGAHWVDPYNREVWKYNIDLAREAILLGFSEIQWDYVRFPDVPARLMRGAVFPARVSAGGTRSELIREFLRYSREELADLGVPITADLFGLAVSVQNDLGIGHNWEALADVTDVLLPMIYPSHFAKGSYGIPIPNADPYRTVRTALDYAVRRSAKLEGGASIRPWLQDFSLGWPSYGAPEVRAQIQATYDAGLTEWILWNPASRYTASALASVTGETPELALPRHLSPEHGEEAEVGEPERRAPLRILGRPVGQDSVPS